MGKRLNSPYFIQASPLRSMLRETEHEKVESVDKSGLMFAQVEPIRDENYLDLVRLLPSVVSGLGPCIAHHVRLPETNGSAGKKPGDNFVVPLLQLGEHSVLHSPKWGDKRYWRFHGVDALLCANWLWNLYCDAWDHDRACEIIAKCRPRAGI